MKNYRINDKFASVDRLCQSMDLLARKEEKTMKSSNRKRTLTFVRAEQYKDQDNEVLEASEKFIKEHPTLGEAGKLFVFFQDIPLK